MKTISLGGKKGFGLVAKVDDQDFHELARFEWCALVVGRNTYAVRGGGGKKFTYMHREIMKPSTKEVVDHIDFDGLNNQRKNMRITSKSLNMAHSKTRTTVKGSKYKGISQYKDSGKWGARIRHHRKLIHLGLFDDQISAAKAYDAAAKEKFGEYAVTNF